MSSTTERGRFPSGPAKAGPSAASRGTRDPSSVRAALLAGFAIVFGLWLLWGYQLVHTHERPTRRLRF